MGRSGQNHKGFSLIEVMIASLILSVGMAGVIAFFPLGIKRVESMVLEKQAVFIANNYMVALRDFVQNRDQNGIGSGFDDLKDGTAISMQYLLQPERVYKAINSGQISPEKAFGRVVIRDASVLGIDIAGNNIPITFGSEPIAREFENSDGTCWVRILFKTLRNDSNWLDLNKIDGVSQGRFIPFAKVFRITVGRGADQHDFWTIIGDYQLSGHLGYPYQNPASLSAGKDLTIPGESTPAPPPPPGP